MDEKSLELFFHISPVVSLASVKIFLFIVGFEQFDYDLSWYGFLHINAVWGFAELFEFVILCL